MAKGEQKSNKEVKKPKKEKPAAAAPGKGQPNPITLPKKKG